MEDNRLKFLDAYDKDEGLSLDYSRYWNDIQKSPHLSPVDKLILQKIKSFCKKGKTFFASNNWLGNNLCIHEKTVSRSISKMIKAGYLEVVLYNGKERELVCTNKTE